MMAPANINVEVWDATGNKKAVVNLPTDAPVNRILVLLVDRMNLPRHSPDGQLMSYKFHHKSPSRVSVRSDRYCAGSAPGRPGLSYYLALAI